MKHLTTYKQRRKDWAKAAIAVPLYALVIGLSIHFPLFGHIFLYIMGIIMGIAILGIIFVFIFWKDGDEKYE